MGTTGYEVLRYRAADEVPWYHVLHGNVPEHQIDFMYGPEVPQGLLTATHFSHLARLMKYIEPQTSATHAFAIGNLSRDDTQHEAGHGAVGLIFGFRIGGATDHAGRRNPPFAHGIIAIDRDLRCSALREAAATFYRHVMNAGEAESSVGNFYRDYMRAVLETPDCVSRVLERYVEGFYDLPQLKRSDLPWEWMADEDVQPKRVVIVHSEDEPFSAIADAASKLAAVLFRSNIKWTSITSGREADISGGVSVRFVSERNLSAEDRLGLVIHIDQVGEEEEEIARTVFGAKPYGAAPERPTLVGWREHYAAQQMLFSAALPAPTSVESAPAPLETRSEEAAVGRAQDRPDGSEVVGLQRAATRAARERARSTEQKALESRTWAWMAVFGACAAAGALAMVLGVMSGAAREAATQTISPTSAGNEQGAVETAPAATPARPGDSPVAGGTVPPVQSARNEQAPTEKKKKKKKPKKQSASDTHQREGSSPGDAPRKLNAPVR